jgi:hypothetical protein
MMYGIPIYLSGFMDVFFLFSKKNCDVLLGLCKSPGAFPKDGAVS